MGILILKKKHVWLGHPIVQVVELLLGRGGRRREESKAGQHKDSKVGNDSKQRNYPSATGCHISVD